MIDIITYCVDTEKLLSELKSKYPGLISEDGKSFIVDKTQTVRNDKATLALLRVDDDLLKKISNLTNLSVLGTYEEIFSEFESCYDPDSIFGAGDVK